MHIEAYRVLVDYRDGRGAGQHNHVLFPVRGVEFNGSTLLARAVLRGLLQFIRL